MLTFRGVNSSTLLFPRWPWPRCPSENCHGLHKIARLPQPRVPNRNDQGVLNLAKSPYAKLRNIPVHAVTITSGFRAARRQTNMEKSIPSMEKLLEGNGRMDNFLRLAGKSDAPQRGPVLSDSDVYKWTEAAAFALQSGDRPELRNLTNKIIKEST